ncbi:MAG TPA: DUF6457 domain-containing protein [Glaciihabitans sp.]|nr:DUF6457 domain-containing protein [Glaciihabitans sp.]
MESEATSAAAGRDLAAWTHELTQALQILNLEADASLIRSVAEAGTRAGGADAGAVTTFLVGYAAGLAAAKKDGTPAESVNFAAQIALKTADPTTADAADGGWAQTAQ